MTTINKELLKKIREEINAALTATSNKYNVTLRAGNASYDPTLGTATFKLELLALNAIGENRDIPAELFLKNADLIGLKKEDLHKEITVSGRKFTVAGYKPKARKNCILIKDVLNGKIFVTDISTAKRKLANI